jgi:translation initiation factor 2B subunit (eIF-2B alpha/beta/delta family)
MKNKEEEHKQKIKRGRINPTILKTIRLHTLKAFTNTLRTLNLSSLNQLISSLENQHSLLSKHSNDKNTLHDTLLLIEQAIEEVEGSMPQETHGGDHMITLEKKEERINGKEEDANREEPSIDKLNEILLKFKQEIRHRG